MSICKTSMKILLYQRTQREITIKIHFHLLSLKSSSQIL
uniref:Uncharacterized protein n=1 Tax=Anguilla anguilla TaxID=7936 RepID=A0A0E9SNX0_ANGAN